MARGNNGKTSRKGKPVPKSRTIRIQVVIEVDEDGNYVAWCPALQGCYTQGGTFEEAMGNTREVIGLCLDELRDDKKEIELRFPEVISIRQVEVAVRQEGRCRFCDRTS